MPTLGGDIFIQLNKCNSINQIWYFLYIYLIYVFMPVMAGTVPYFTIPGYCLLLCRWLQTSVMEAIQEHDDLQRRRLEESEREGKICGTATILDTLCA